MWSTNLISRRFLLLLLLLFFHSVGFDQIQPSRIFQELLSYISLVHAPSSHNIFIEQMHLALDLQQLFQWIFLVALIYRPSLRICTVWHELTSQAIVVVVHRCNTKPWVRETTRKTDRKNNGWLKCIYRVTCNWKSFFEWQPHPHQLPHSNIKIAFRICNGKSWTFNWQDIVLQSVDIPPELSSMFELKSSETGILFRKLISMHSERELFHIWLKIRRMSLDSFKMPK